MTLLIVQTFSQRTWPKAGDVDDCWCLTAIQCTNAVAPWLPLLDVRAFRAAAGDPDDGVSDGGNVGELMTGIRKAWPKLGPLVTPLEGAPWPSTLEAIKSGRPASLAVVSSRLPLPYGFSGLHQVTIFHEPGVGLRIANPLAPDRSEPTRIATASIKAAAEAYGRGKIFGVLWPTVTKAFPTHPLYVAPSAGKYTQAQADAMVAAARLETAAPLEARIRTMHGLARQIEAT